MSLRDKLESASKDALAAKVTGRLRELADKLEASDISVDELGKARMVRLGSHQGLIKTADGEAEIHELENYSIEIDPRWAAGPEWPAVQPAAPVKVKVDPVKSRSRRGWGTAVILPDPQIGFRRYEDGTLDPLHDDQAMACAMKVAQAAAPDLIILLGDLLDLTEMGRYEQEETFQLGTQLALDRAHEWLATLRATFPGSEIRLIEGNHDRRLPKAIRANYMAAANLKRANVPAGWPVLSVPYLLHLDELDIEYVSGYPAAETAINPGLICKHGDKVRSRGSTASAVIRDIPTRSVIFGHVHRIEAHYHRCPGRHEILETYAATPGTLARIDGAVPGSQTATDALGKPVPRVMDWQHGLAVVEYERKGWRSHLELIQIHAGETFWRGRRIVAK